MKKILTFCMCVICALTFFPAFLSAQVNLNKGLVAYYPFNGNANDASGNTHDGTVYNATLTTDRYGHSKSAYSFNGKEGISVYPFGNSNTGTIGGTMSCWMKTTSTEQGVEVLWGVPGTMWINLFTTGRYLGVFDGVGSSHSSSDENKSTINDGNWYNLTTTNDGSYTRVYVNGALQNTYSDQILQTSVGLIIGGVNGGSGNGYTGNIDDVRIYFRQLSDSEVMAIYQMPFVAFGTKNVCANDSMHFADSSIAAAGSKYLWDFGDGTTSSASNPAHLYANAGNYTVSLTVTSPYGSSDIISKKVTVNPVPTQPVITQSGHLLLTSGGATYQWFLNGAAINGATLAYYQPLVSKGSFAVTIADANGCSSTSDVFNYDVSGIENPQSLDNITIYPNPAHDYLTIDLGSSAVDIQSLQIIDMNGKCVKMIEQFDGKGTVKVSTGNIARGMYFIKFTGKENTFIQKVVVE